MKVFAGQNQAPLTVIFNSTAAKGEQPHDESAAKGRRETVCTGLESAGLLYLFAGGDMLRVWRLCNRGIPLLQKAIFNSKTCSNYVLQQAKGAFDSTAVYTETWMSMHELPIKLCAVTDNASITGCLHSFQGLQTPWRKTFDTSNDVPVLLEVDVQLFNYHHPAVGSGKKNPVQYRNEQGFL